MICMECQKACDAYDSWEYATLMAYLRDGKKLPSYTVHKKCARNKADFPSVCVGHRTPPGLDDIEKWMR